MRIEGQSKLGYYPTPNQTLARILTWLEVADPGPRRYFDPCCGKGEALAAIAANRGPAETYGIELSDVRAREAESVLTRVLNTGFENAVLSDEAYSLCLLNPPYDGEGMTGGGTRMEESFLITFANTYKLVEGGILVYIIPHQRINEKIARHLSGWYSDLRCFKLPEEEYEVFHQCIIFGARRKRYVTPSGDDLRQAAAWANGQQVTGYIEVEEEVEQATEKGMKRVKVKKNQPVLADLPYLPEGRGEYTIPTSESRIPFRFVYVAVTPEELLREAETAAVKLNETANWRSLAPRMEPEVYVPAMTPKKGHISLQVSGGLLGSNLVRMANGAMQVIKGAIHKIQVTKIGDDEKEVVDPDKEDLTRVEVNEKFENLFSTLDETGELRTTNDPHQIAKLLDEYVGQLAEQLQMRNQPRYDMKPEPWEWAVFDNLSRGRVLPGRGGQTGLTDFQKHLAIALGRLALAEGSGFINAEMGSGKAQPLDAKILTPYGWKCMGEIRVGDRVINPDGGTSTVLGVFPQGEKDIYRVTFSDGSSTETCAEHLWTVNTPERKWRGHPRKTLQLQEIMNGLVSQAGNYRYFIPMVKPVEYECGQNLPVPPYLLGALLGDGGLSHGCVIFSTADLETLERIIPLLPVGITPKHRQGTYDYALSGKIGCKNGKSHNNNPLINSLRSLGLKGKRSEDKFIPEQYLFASVQDRIALLQGLLDTDGTVNRTSHIELTTVSNRLAADLQSLVQSLGGIAKIVLKKTHYPYHGEIRNGKLAYRVHITLPAAIQPFALSRKTSQYVPAKKYGPNRAIATVELVGRKQAQCIAVDAENQLYITDDYIVTHNTSVSIAICEYLRVALERRGSHNSAYPAMVVGPGIVTGAENWPKEVVEVTPGAIGKAVTIGVKPLAKSARILAWLKDQGLVLEDDEFIGLSAKQVTARIEATARDQGTLLPLAALAQSLQRAEKYPPIRRKGASAPNLLDGRIGGYLWLGMPVPRDAENQREIARQYSLPQFLAEYRAGKLPQKSFAILSYETAKLGSGRVPAMKTRTVRQWDEVNGVRTSRLPAPGAQAQVGKVCTCPVCGAIVSDGYDPESRTPIDIITPSRAEQWVGLRRRFCQAPKPRRVWNPEKGKHFIQLHDEDGHAYVCGAPLFEESALRRISAGSYALKKARKAFGMLLVDEVHEAKGKGTGVGWCLGALSAASCWTLGLTGTLFGGYSTSIFMLWYRLIGAVRKEFAFNGEQAWAEKFGLIKHTFYTDREPDMEEQGAFTGTKFFETVSERPGISPEIVRYGLPYCTFSSLKDIGLPLPAYNEEIVRIPMTEAMKAQYDQADRALFNWALQEKKKPGGKGAISVWLNTALNRPDAMFRPEFVRFNRRVGGKGRYAIHVPEVVRDFPKVIDEGELLPKEKWLADTCQAERLHGRKTLVFVRQTGERDVQERLKTVLEARGLRVGILKPTLAPERRATWIKQHAHEFDVLLTNARLVKVGLNLIMFSTAIFFELEWSLYVVWQAMRRLYRPGATKPVQLYFPVYEATLEEAALNLIGQKMTAAMMFYGDEVAGALTEGDEGDLLNDLVRMALGKLEVGRTETMFGVGSQMAATEAAYGSPTAVSPIMEGAAWGDALREWAARLGKSLPERRASRAKKAPAVPEGQLGFGF